MDDNYIHFSIDGRDLKIHKETPDDIFMLKTHGGGYKMKNPRWNQIKIQTNDKDGYKRICINKKLYLLHRVNYYAHNQTWNIHDSSQSNQVDHENDKGDLPKNQYNNIENLRVVTNQQNQWNRNCKGYCYCKRSQKWYTRIKINGKTKYLGLFLLEEDAHKAYLEAKKIFHIIK
jgi:hypothetical protein